MNATPLAVISSMATKALLTELLAEFQRLPPGRAVALESVGGVDAARRVAAGEALDAVVLGSDAIDQLIASGHVRAGSRVDIVRSGVDGLLVPVDNSELLAQAMARLMSDSALRAGLGSRAREVAERFAPETVGREWDALFARLLGDHAP